MRVDIDHALCEGYGVCAQAAPEIFVLFEDGGSAVVKSEVGEDLELAAVLAEQSCPMQAIQLS